MRYTYAVTCTRKYTGAHVHAGKKNDVEIFLTRRGVGQITVRPGLRTTSSVSSASGVLSMPIPTDFSRHEDIVAFFFCFFFNYE